MIRKVAREDYDIPLEGRVLTKGKTYECEEVQIDGRTYYYLRDDLGDAATLSTTRFLTTEETREMKLKEMGI